MGSRETQEGFCQKQRLPSPSRLSEVGDGNLCMGRLSCICPFVSAWEKRNGDFVQIGQKKIAILNIYSGKDFAILKKCGKIEIAILNIFLEQVFENSDLRGWCSVSAKALCANVIMEKETPRAHRFAGGRAAPRGEIYRRGSVCQKRIQKLHFIGFFRGIKGCARLI